MGVSENSSCLFLLKLISPNSEINLLLGKTLRDHTYGRWGLILCLKKQFTGELQRKYCGQFMESQHWLLQMTSKWPITYGLTTVVYDSVVIEDTKWQSTIVSITSISNAFNLIKRVLTIEYYEINCGFRKSQFVLSYNRGKRSVSHVQRNPAS